MVSVVETVNISQLEAAFNTDLGDQQNPLQTGIYDYMRLSIDDTIAYRPLAFQVMKNAFDTKEKTAVPIQEPLFLARSHNELCPASCASWRAAHLTICAAYALRGVSRGSP
jgi:hypothetical protein